MIKRTRSLAVAIVVATVVATINMPTTSGLPAGAPKTGMVCTSGLVSGSTRTFDLVASAGYIDTPDGNSVLMWSYADIHDPTTPDFQYPGPVLCATQGETVVVNLTNRLPEASSIVFPGQDAPVIATGGVPGLLTTGATASNGTVSYRFTAGNAGTYIYESGSNISKQIEMGLYGALIIRPNTTDCPVVAGTGCGYNATNRFNLGTEFLLLLSDFDPALHHAVETGGSYDINNLHNRYFAVNGRSFPDTVKDNGTALMPRQPYGSLVRIQPFDGANVSSPYHWPALIRMINAGAANHPFHPHGDHFRQIAEDGRLFVSPGGGDSSSERFGETIGSGETEDYILKWDDQDRWNPNDPAHQLPVAQPNYRNLVFKDGVTWYSGNPYLGYKGTLPTGTASLNVCGEWYFPLHSHALFEFANFDEPFGGMATLLRVDPPGGCFTFPSASKILAGTLNSGSVTNLAFDDAKYYVLNSAATPTPPTGQHTDWYAQFSGVVAGATNLSVTYKGASSVALPSVATETLFIWNWTTSAWVQLGGTQNLNTSDVTVTRGPLNGTYIGTGANVGLVRARVLTTRTGTGVFTTSGNLMTLTYNAP